MKTQQLQYSNGVWDAKCQKSKIMTSDKLSKSQYVWHYIFASTYLLWLTMTERNWTDGIIKAQMPVELT